MVVINQTGSITIANARLLHMFGYKRFDELAGKNVSILMPPPYNALHDGFLLQYLATGTSTARIPLRSARAASGSRSVLTVDELQVIFWPQCLVGSDAVGCSARSRPDAIKHVQMRSSTPRCDHTRLDAIKHVQMRPSRCS